MNQPALVLVLRTCDANLRSHEGFQWPAAGPVEAPDWSPTPKCGHGLHGLLWGEGDGSLLSWAADAKWLVVEVPAEGVVGLGDKVKFPRGKVLFAGSQEHATAYLADRHPGAIVGHTSTSGDGGTSLSGEYGTSLSGEYGTSTSGAYGTSISGYRGRSTSGDGGTSTSGCLGTSTSGDGGTSTSGAYGTLIFRHDGAREQWVVAHVGEGGIRADTPYRLDEQGNVVEVKP